MVKQSRWFHPTVTMTPELIQAVKAGTFKLREGQYIADPRKGTGRFVAARDGKIYVSWNKGEPMEEYTQRFARARHAQRQFKDAKDVVMTAPKTQPLSRIKNWIAQRVA